MIEVTLQLEQLTAAEDFVEGDLLGHVAQALANAPGVGQGIQPSHLNPAAGWGQQRGQDAQGGGFACPIRAEQPKQAAGGNLQVQTIEGVDSFLAFAVALGDVLQINHWMSHRRRPR